MAKEADLDLVMVSPNANPPVCKIIDYGKYKYDTKQRERESKKKTQDVKGIQISPRIAEHDLMTQLKKAQHFLEDGHKVKVTCRFRAREVTRPELGKTKMDRMSEILAEMAVVERTPIMEGRMMTMILAPKPKKESKKDAKAENKQDGGEALQDHGERKDHPAEGVQQPPVPAQEQRTEETPGAGA